MHFLSYARTLWRHHRGNESNGSKGRLLLLGGSAPCQGLRQVGAAGIVLQQPVAARLQSLLQLLVHRARGADQCVELSERITGLLHGFQLWLNLPAARKMDPAAYQEITREQIPVVEFDGGSLRLIAGEYGGVSGPVDSGSTEATYMDLRLQAGSVAVDSGVAPYLRR